VKTIEVHYNGDWRDKLLNAWPLCVHTDAVATLFALALDAQGIYRPDSRSLFYNGFVMVRLTWPFGIWLHIKPTSTGRFQCGIGWKLNGRIALLFRWQTDASAAAGVRGPNVGQASAWDRGTA
jgi:hypothetical protein